jgi:hypothetical protein
MVKLNLKFKEFSLLLCISVIALALISYAPFQVMFHVFLFFFTKSLYVWWSCSHNNVLTNHQRSGLLMSTNSATHINHKANHEALPSTCLDYHLEQDATLLKNSGESTDKMESRRTNIVFIPSQSFDQRELAKVKAPLQYEERTLCMLFELADPNVSIVYVTSMPVDASIVDYYLELLETTSNVYAEDARSRLLILSCNDPQLIPLTAKVLRRPKLIQKIKEFIKPSYSYIIPFLGSNLERELALTLQIPLIGTDPSLNYWGTKAGGREVFGLAGLPLPAGTGLVQSVEELAAEVLKLYLREGRPRQIVIKLNVGFSGKGNALLTASKISPDETVERVLELLETDLEFCSHEENWKGFQEQLKLYGVLAEIWVPNVISSPSAQATILVSGEVKVISTHEQVLDGGAYLGCIYPANELYRSRLIDYAYKIGKVLADKGCLERFAVDFVVSDTGAEIEVNCIEINIRWGGTSHPFISAKYLTKGEVSQDGRLMGADGLEKFYVSSDNIQNEAFIGLNPDDFLDLTKSRESLSFSSESLTGTTFHMISAIPQFGKFGMIAIANSCEAAQQLYQQALDELKELANEVCNEKVFLELDLSIK